MLRLCAIVGLLLLAASASGQSSSLRLTVTDENGIGVPGAVIQLQGPAALRCETDHAGRCSFRAPAGSYRLAINKDGFYALSTDLRLPEVSHLDLNLAHVQEVKESVDVVASTPQIDPTQIANTQSLDSQEIIDIPYPTTRDIREALPLIPGVVRDFSGQAHVAGGATCETLDTLDGFNIGHPVTGTLDLRFSSDAVREIDVQGSRYSTEFGQSSAGVIGFATGMGDDRVRFSATNFIPSVQNKKGLNFDKWTPRATLSGPIVKGKAWFLLAPDGEYDNNIIKDLPSGADTNPLWRVSSLAKVQVNLTQANILSGSYLINHFHSDFDGLSFFTPKETTLLRDDGAYLATIKDQHYFSSGMLFEIGAAVNQYDDTARPMGTLPYVMTPGLARGNFFESTRGSSRRIEGISNLYLPLQHLGGRHEIRVGLVIDRLDDTQHIQRSPISILRADGTLYSHIVFTGPHTFSQDNIELGAYLQDRWSPTDRLLVQAGIRFDHDRFVGRTMVAPRLGVTYKLSNSGDTKLSAGIGIYHDATNLERVTQPLQGGRLQYIYDATGTTIVGPPLPTAFSLNRNTLAVPRFLNWSVGLERRLPAAILVNAQYMQRDGSHGFAYTNLSTVPLIGQYLLTNTRRDHYRAFQISARRSFSENHEVLIAYTRSRARSNEVVDFTLDNPVFSPQASGALPWDSPNKLVSWGFLPFPRTKKWDIAYSADWHTGFPFSVVNQKQEIVGSPNSRRFPDYFALNLFLERRFALRGLNLALRGGFEDLTGRRNPFTVNNNIDSPNFLQFEAATGRAFTARIRFLGRKR
ncbi:MAG: TonB-dependent receptor [Acidobacteriia bacterium]|nr:TonB-dependent receptor [Terriglobia bacterium]